MAATSSSVLTASPSSAAVASRLTPRLFAIPNLATLAPGTTFGNQSGRISVDPSSPYFTLFAQIAVGSGDPDDIPLFETEFQMLNAGSTVGQPVTFRWGGQAIPVFSADAPSSVVQVMAGYQVVAIHSAYTNTCSGQGNTGDATGIVARWSGYCDQISVITRFLGWGNKTPVTNTAEFTHGVLQQPWGSM